MRAPWTPPCAAHRDALVEFAACRTAGPAVRRALDHVAHCERCERELATTTLLVHALRRLHAESLRAEPAADGWTRLQERLAVARRRPSLLLSGIPGLLVAVGLCGVLGGPLVVSEPVTVYDEGTWITSRTSPAIVFEEASDRRPAFVLPIPSVPAVGVTDPGDDLARAIVGLRTIPAALPGPDIANSGPQTAPTARTGGEPAVKH